MGGSVSQLGAWNVGRRVDVVIVTAIRPEFDAVLSVNAGAVPGTTWETTSGPSGLPVAFRPFVVDSGRPLRVAVAVAPDMGATATLNTLLPLLPALAPRCIAMCGVCAGRRGKVRLGDVVVGDRIFFHDAGKQLPEQIQQDLTTYKLRDDWKAALAGLDVIARFRDEEWFKARPLTTEWREYRTLVALRNGVPEPWKAVDSTITATEWRQVIAALRDRNLLVASGSGLTEEGYRAVDSLVFEHMGELPDMSPAGAFQPFRLHVAPIGSGARVLEDEAIWTFISRAMYKTLGLEMESAALGELAHRQRQYKLDAIVMKGVMDFAEHGRDDHFKEFAARAAAECMLWFLRKHVPTEIVAGFDDLITPGTLPRPEGSRSPSFLLNARYALVPWHESSRAEILDDLDAWADDPRAVSVRLLHADGGVGKTRLAIEWVGRRLDRHDVAGFLVANPDSRWLEKLCSLGSPVQVVIDYAETRSDLAALLERVAAFAAVSGPHRRVRILILARNDGDWWTELQRHSSMLGALLDDDVSMKLPPLAATTTERERVFCEAAAAFATIQHRAWTAVKLRDLSDARFERVLYLHMAALATVEGLEFDAGSLMDVILDHEERFWTSHGTDRHVIGLDVALARQMVVVATLRGGLATVEDAHTMCLRVTHRERTREDDALIALLHDVYDRENELAYLPRLEPDLLAEAMVRRLAEPHARDGRPDKWIERVFVAEDDPSAVTEAFIVLGRASATAPAVVRPWIDTLLQVALPRRARLALRAAKMVGKWTASSILGDALAETLERYWSVAIALDLEQEQIPYPTVSLQRVAEWQARILVASAPLGKPTVKMEARAARLRRHGITLLAMGQLETALAAMDQAVELYRTLARRNPNAFQHHLASSLSNLGTVLDEMGRHEAAYIAIREGVAISRVIAKRDPAAFQHYLAMCLSNLGMMLNTLGHHEPALGAMREAVGLYRTLARRNPDAFQCMYAGSLTNLGTVLSALGRREPALTAARDAVKLYQALAARNPDAFQPMLATSLNGLGRRLSAMGQREAAFEVSREAVDLYRILARRNPDAFQLDLANNLRHLGDRFLALGRPEQALEATNEAVDLCRTLIKRHPEALQPDLASSVGNLGNVLRELGQRDEALVAAREAVEIYRALAARTPDAFRDDLAGQLNNLSNALSALGQREQALAAASEAVEIYRTVATHNPGGFLHRVAACLTTMANASSALGHHESAREAAHEAVTIYRALAANNSDAFQSDLVASLNILGNTLSDLGQRAPALEATREAVELYRALTARNPEAFQPALAGSLNNLGNRLRAVGHRDLALETTREAVQLHRKLAARNPDAFQPRLATSLQNLGVILSELGQPERALQLMYEAVGLCRALATSHSTAFLRDLARSLGKLGKMLSALGEREPALTAMHEAMKLNAALEERRPGTLHGHVEKALNHLGTFGIVPSKRIPALSVMRELMELYRTCAAQKPDEFQLDLSDLENACVKLREIGQEEVALTTMRETVDLFRVLAKRNRDTFAPELAESLCCLSIMLGELRQYDPALEAIREAVGVYRELAEGDRERFLADLATSLDRLGTAWSALDDHERAGAAAAEAAEIRCELASTVNTISRDFTRSQ
jgi:tetratricopeptide (TPR) repeat protein/nucleoside phosphorylase